MSQDISDYKLIANSFVRYGSVFQDDRQIPVVMIINNEYKVVFLYDLHEVDDLIAQISSQRALAASGDRPVRKDDWITINAR